MLRNNKKEVTDMVFPNIEIYRTPDIDALPSPRTLQTHMRFRRLPQHFLENKGKIIYVMRNPKDIAVSMFKFILKLKEVYSGTWDDYLHLFYEGKRKYTLIIGTLSHSTSRLTVRRMWPTRTTSVDYIFKTKFSLYLPRFFFLAKSLTF